MSQNDTWASLEQKPWTHSDPGCNRFFALRDIWSKQSLRGEPLFHPGKKMVLEPFLLFYYVTWHTQVLTTLCNVLINNILLYVLLIHV